MMDRRQFMWTAFAGPTMLARPSSVWSQARYDLIVKGGRVIDPSLRLDAIRDIAVVGGRIAAVAPAIAADAADTIDARGKLVVPGLIDIHTHAARIKDGPALCLADGVTGFIDAGSQGADGIDETVAFTRSAPQPGRVLVNIGRAGVIPAGDTMDLTHADVEAARNAMSHVFDVFRDRGMLNVGAPADMAVLELREGSFEFVDNYGNKRTGTRRLFPSATVLAGARVPAHG